MSFRQSLSVFLLLALLLPAVPACAQGPAGPPQKVVYLTFDDGPKADTPELLAVLDALDVPATFFLMGASVRMYPEHARMIYEAGYPIGCHSMGHKYSYLKENVHHIGMDLPRFTALMREVVGDDFKTDLYRFPGGSSSYSGYARRYVADQGYAWFDWNVMTGDAQYTFKSDQEMLDYTLSQVRGQDVIILLMHEAKERTRRILPELVVYFRENGYEFRALSTGGEDRAILASCGARMMLPETAGE